MKKPALRLISFNLCPFVQRSVILLKEKGIDFELTYINLKEKPDWFLEISPLGKVPVLLVDGTPVFESAVIAEYLDETVTPQLHPIAPLTKAIHRSWIEFSSTLIMAQYRYLMADTDEQREKERLAIYDGLTLLSEQCDPVGPFFTGQTLCLMDTTIAPLFMRMDILIENENIEFYPNARIKQWAAALKEKNTVKQSVIEEFKEEFTGYFDLPY